MNLELAQLDVKTAFLYSRLNEEIFMSQPDGFKVANVTKMQVKKPKSLLGLKGPKLEKVELTVAYRQDNVGDLEEHITELEMEKDELREGMQGALNEGLFKCQEQTQIVEQTLLGEINTLTEKLEVMSSKLQATEENVALLKKAVTQECGRAPVGVPNRIRIDVPRPKAYLGERNAKEIDNFL
ncbi:uncharacterized protein LOC124935075 [Impatiens glandulifera]|uniref:uncharacterized protein LOC124935075 n=1 Tax=Impatiens glandulifera TaxID=253017 RepID=UPI001FB08726|nr:uncharacterized protein LOC124935075 [Impatiens glandulifera]